MQIDKEIIQYEIQKCLDEIPGTKIHERSVYLAVRLGVLREIEQDQYPKGLLQQVKDMHKKFEISAEDTPFGGVEEYTFRTKCMQEEIDEFWKANTKVDQLDALVDLMIFALGTVERLGFSEVFYTAFERVMQANMKKVMSASDAHRAYSKNLKKPEGWVAPDLTDLVNENEEKERGCPF